MANLLNLSKEESANLLELRKEKVNLLCLEKKSLNNLTSRVGIVLDYSGSMSQDYSDGTVQAILERTFPLALQFDDNGEMEVWIFADGKNFHRLPNMNKQNYYGYVKREITDKRYRMGGTDYSYVLEDVYEKYMVEEPAALPVYLKFVTDGDNSDRQKTTEMIRKMSKCPIFIQFVGIGSGSSYLKQLDDMDGRYVDNANYFNADNINNMDDDALYDKLLKEYPSWIELPQVKEMIAKAGTSANSLNGGDGGKKGFFGKFFG